VRGAVDVEFESVLIGITQVKGLADAMIACSLERNLMGDESTVGFAEGGTVRIKECHVVESRAARRGRGAAEAFPCIQSDMMMVSPRRDKSGGIPVALCDFESEHFTIEVKCPVEIRNFQVDMSNRDLRIDRV
jgi:hypothetical protein